MPAQWSTGQAFEREVKGPGFEYINGNFSPLISRHYIQKPVWKLYSNIPGEMIRFYN